MAKYRTEIVTKNYAVLADDAEVILYVVSGDGHARLSVEQTDELIRALGAARVAVSRATP